MLIRMGRSPAIVGVDMPTEDPPVVVDGIQASRVTGCA
jgi:hypothetical protein